mgnify:FL=1
MVIPDNLYDLIIHSIPIACVDVAIIARGSVLLVKRNDAPAKGEWWLPGGRVHKGETMRQTAKRKALEEVGIECHVGPIIHTAETIFQDGPNGIPVHSINSCFLLFPIDELHPIVKLDSHHSQSKWVNYVIDGLHPYVIDCLLGVLIENTGIE